jgi:hypothetical protein
VRWTWWAACFSALFLVVYDLGNFLASEIGGWGQQCFDWLGNFGNNITNPGWLFPIAASLYSVLLSVVGSVLPDGLAEQASSFTHWVSTDAGVGKSVALALWGLDYFVDTNVLATCLFAFSVVFPVCVVVRLVLWVYHQMWGSN